ncbi:hypothetical protein [Actinomadura sp. KC345]|uniref:hypothetical protein n=1 Tax=Actinomadura sp. KC345 TaxID=2530371 RepID=UPI0010475C0C|nr:hypothetical protein [Actinomadura sp. KC345]
MGRPVDHGRRSCPGSRSKEPELAEHAAAGLGPRMFSVSAPPDVEQTFARGLDRLLDGLAPVIEDGH